VAVAVYPQLDALLRDRGLSVLEVKRAIEDRYGLVVDLAMLQGLTGSEPVDLTDLTLAGAVATVLGVSLSDLFSIEATPASGGLPAGGEHLSNEASRRLLELLTLQDSGNLNERETNELQQLVDEYGRSFRDEHIRHYAMKVGISLADATRQADSRVSGALTWLRDLDAQPGGRQAFIERVKQRRASASH